MEDNTFEKFPGSSPEVSAERSVPPEQDFGKSFAEGVPEFSGDKFGIAHENNDYYGESVKEESESAEYNDGVANAASLINYGLDAIAREKGVEVVVQGIKSFDTTGSENPLRDLYDHLGIDTREEFEDVRDESMASKFKKTQFREEYNMPKTEKRTREGMFKAIADMKELIAEVEGADPRYEELRQSAKSYGRGYFEYAVKDFGLRGLTDLFSVLAEQKQEKEAEGKKEKTRQEEKQDKPQLNEPQPKEETDSEEPQPDVELEENTPPEEPQPEAEQPKTPENSEESKPNPDNPEDFYEQHSEVK